MNRIKLFIVFLFSGILLKGQITQQFIYDPVEQSTIPYANIYIKDGSKGWVSDKNGAFIYDQKAIKPTDVLVISAMGYQEKRVPYFLVKDCTIIELNQRPITLNEVQIKARRYKSARLGKKRKANDNFNTGIRKHELENIPPEAIFIPNHIGAEGILDEIKIFIKKGSIIPFKIQLYDSHLLDGSPKNKLLDKPIYVKETEDRTWLSIMITKENISIPPKGIFVSIDWNIDTIYVEKSDTLIRKIYFTGEKKAKNDTIISKGAVIGENFTKEWNRWMFDKEKGWYNLWEYLSSLDSNSKYNHDKMKYQTLAIYCNVLYDKSVKKYQEDILDENGIASQKVTKRITKKRFGKSKKDQSKYPQNNIKELFVSLKRALETDQISYIFNHLFFYSYEEIEAILELEKVTICSDQCKKENLEKLNSVIESINKVELKEIESNYYTLITPSFKTTVLFRDGDWRISPTLIIKKSNDNKSLD